METVIVTGGAGFIGCNLVRLALARQEWRVVVVDALTYAGHTASLADLEKHPRYAFVRADIADGPAMARLLAAERPRAVVNLAAETHVDRSIDGPRAFVRTNVVGTFELLDAAREFWSGLAAAARDGFRFLHVSTDEVYGSLNAAGKFVETTPLHPNSPYSASKASSDLLALAYFHTFHTPVIVTRCSNNYGPFQFPEKLIPLMIANALNDKPLPVYGDGLNVRDWLYVEDHCSALDAVLHKGKEGEVYNIGGNNEKKNIEIVKLILQELEKPESLITFVQDRLGHDRRYAIDASKIKNELGWEPTHTFEIGIRETIHWYLSHKEWWQRILSGEYQQYYSKQYGERLKKEVN
jgi:dTDP-glucose 4,6-dehydratase